MTCSGVGLTSYPLFGHLRVQFANFFVVPVLKNCGKEGMQVRQRPSFLSRARLVPLSHCVEYRSTEAAGIDMALDPREKASEVQSRRLQRQRCTGPVRLFAFESLL